MTWLLAFSQATGAAAERVVAARRGDLRERVGNEGASAWFIRVHGKGRKNQLVVVPAAAMTATRAYFTAQGANLETAPAEAPLLAALTGGAPRLALSHSRLAGSTIHCRRRVNRIDDQDSVTRSSQH